MKITWELLDDIATSLEHNPYPNYSGRGMYGRNCAGIELDGDADLLALGAVIAEMVEDEDLKTSLMRGVRLDSMGLGIIAYWPSIQCEDSPEDYED